MRRNIIKSGIILLSAVVGCTVFNSCKDDVFNAEKVKAAYQDKFPVKDIDPNMDWKMTQQVKVNVSINEDALTDYTIRLYDSNPLIEDSSAKLLAEGTANNLQSFTTVMDCPSTLTEIYVCRVDAHSRNVVKYASIQNREINVTFGKSQADTRSAWTRSVIIEKYSPEKSESDIKAMLSSAEEITPDTDYKNNKVYKISKNKTFERSINKGGLNADNPAIIIIEGNWFPKSEMSVERGFEFYVINGGKITIPNNKTFTLKESSRFIVYKGGEIGGANSSDITTNVNNNIELTNASQGKKNYNAGNIYINRFHVSGSGVFYNSGSVRVKDMDFDSGCKFINQGFASIDKTHSNITIDNACYLIAKTFVGKLNLGTLSAADIDVFGDKSNNYNTHINMDGNSMITINKEAHLEGVKFTNDSKDHALVKIAYISNIGNFSSSGRIYYEVERMSNFTAWEATFLRAIMNDNASISIWGESPLYIPIGDCTGKGNIPSDTGSETPVAPVPYTYVFEDNFPRVGDYDFNDVVIDVSAYYDRDPKSNRIQQIQLSITLTAAGASKALGVGLRIVGINKSDIKSISTAGDAERFQNSFKDPSNKFKYNNGNHMENSDPNVVIPIVGEVHNVFGVELGKLVNTGGASVTAKAYTYRLIFDLADQTKIAPLFSKDNLDFFICYQYLAMGKRMEVHLYEFWKYGATAAGTVQQENLDLAGNNTWAICVPNGFKYPKELINISRTDEPSASAYPEFIYWAKDRSKYQNWYANPVKENVYR